MMISEVSHQIYVYVAQVSRTAVITLQTLEVCWLRSHDMTRNVGIV